MVTRSIALASVVSFFLVSSAAGINPCEVATLTEPEGADGFGASTGISGDWIVVGAGGEAPNSSGAAYFFRREEEEWIQQQRVRGSQIGDSSEAFGASVAIDGEWAVIGAPNLSFNPFGAGQAYVFRFDGLNWVEHAFLVPSISHTGDVFGQSVDIEGDVIVVGAPQVSVGQQDIGRVFVFRFDGSAWVEKAALSREPSTAAAELAWRSVAISGNRIVAGDRRDSSTVEDAGAVFVFAHDGNTWSQETKLVANDPGVNAWVGDVVAIEGTTVVTGARAAAYIFEFGPGVWQQKRKLTNDVSPFFDTNFGIFTAVSGGRAFVYGAPGVFVYETSGSLWRRTGTATSHSGTDHGHLSIDGNLLVSRTIVFNLLGGALCIPSVSEWGGIMLALLLVTVSTILLRLQCQQFGPQPSP